MKMTFAAIKTILALTTSQLKDISPKVKDILEKSIKKVAPGFQFSIRMAPASDILVVYVSIKNWDDFVTYDKDWMPELDDIWDVKSWKKLEDLFKKIEVDAAKGLSGLSKQLPGFSPKHISIEYVSPNGSRLGK